MENNQTSTSTTNETMFCPNCGKSIPRKSSFCPECGAKNALASASTVTPVEPTTATPQKEESEVKADITNTVSVCSSTAPTQPTSAVAPPRVPCKKCGALLSPKMTYCSVCGKKVAAKKSHPAKKIIIIAIIAVATVIALLFGAITIGLLVGGNNTGSSTNNGSTGIISGKTTVEDKLKSAYDTHCSSSYATLGSDGSYLEIDTNPYNYDDYIDTDAYHAIEKVNNYLGLPSYLFSEMGKTTAMMGRQSETFSDLGLSVSWSYHPDNGLVVTYKVSN